MKPHPSIIDALRHTPTPGEINEMVADTRLLHRGILAEAVQQASARLERECRSTKELRHEYHAVYARLVKDMAAIYPVVICFENALRTSYSYFCRDHFGREIWWEYAYQRMIEGDMARDVRRLYSKPVNIEFSETLFYTMNKIEKTQNRSILHKAENCDDLLRFSTLGDIDRLVRADWQLARAMFLPASKISKSPSNYFRQRMKIIVDTRNAIFHSNPTNQKRKAYSAAEEILDALGMDLPLASNMIAASHVSEHKWEIVRANHHICPPTAQQI